MNVIINKQNRKLEIRNHTYTGYLAVAVKRYQKFNFNNKNVAFEGRSNERRTMKNDSFCVRRSTMCSRQRKM